jgi:ribosomal protein L37AE/L43A
VERGLCVCRGVGEEGPAAMAADTCEACGVGTVAMDSVYGIMACDNCGHVMERGGTFVKSSETGALAACGLGGSHLHSANREDVNKVSNDE